MPNAPLRDKRGPCPRCKTRPRNKKSTYCKECGAEIAREKYAENPDAHRQYKKRWREQHPEQAKAAKRRYNHSERGQQKRRAYRRSPKGKAIAKRYAESEAGKAAQKRGERAYRERLRNLTANLPVEVVRPFVVRMVKEADADYVLGGKMGASSGKSSGYVELARLTGVSRHTLYDIVKKKSMKSVDIGVADKLAMYGDFTLGELYERAEEWAFLTKSEWPKGYSRRQRKAPKRKRKRGNTKKAILRLLEEAPMNQREFADRLGFTNTSAVSKCLAPLLFEGKIEQFRLPGERRRRYRLAQPPSN